MTHLYEADFANKNFIPLQVQKHQIMNSVNSNKGSMTRTLFISVPQMVSGDEIKTGPCCESSA